MHSSVLPVITFLPLMAAFFILLLPGRNGGVIRAVGLIATLLTFLISLKVLFGFVPGEPGMQFTTEHPWIPELGISFSMGIDGISLFLVLLTTFLMPITMLSSWKAIDHKVKEFTFFMLLMECGMIGVFASLDMVLFYVFWELILIPMYFLIGIWGGKHRIYAAVKFFLFTMAGSVLMLAGIIYIYFQMPDGAQSFSILQMVETVRLTGREQFLLFAAFALAFAIKVPMFPFHTWLPDAHVEAPTAGSVVLAAILLKMGTYGFLRFAMPLFPGACTAFLPLLMILSVIGIIYGAWVAMVQPDVKKLVAFSSVSHLGFTMLGIFVLNTQGVTGGILQMINHGISTGALFLLVGIIYERRHTRLIEDFGGLAKVMPAFAAVFLIITLSSIGLPGTNGFVGEFLILLGAFGKSVPYAVFASTGVIFAAVYMLWMYQRVMFGTVKNEKNKNLSDLDLREYLVLVPMVLMVFWIGLFPNYFLSRIEPSAELFLQRFESRTALLQNEQPLREIDQKLVLVEDPEKWSE